MESGYLEARTSGSTGSPKIIRLPQQMVRASAWRTINFFGLTAESHLHSCISPEFIGGKMMVIRALELGCTLTYEPPSNRPVIGDQPVDLLAVVPSMMWDLVKRQAEGNLPEIRNIIIGGAPVPPPLRSAIAESGLNSFETYGMTETASHIALRKVSNEDDTHFYPLDGIRINTDPRGCLAIEIEGISDRIVTNDIAEISADGGFLILGRADNVIITGGRKVFPEQIERKISHLINGDFIISSRPSEKWGEELIIIAEYDQDLDKSTVLEIFKNILAPHERPRDILTEKLERTTSGKVIRKKLSGSGNKSS